MRKINRYVSSLLGAICLVLSACNDFLEQYPDSNTHTEVDSKEKIAQLLTAAYPEASYFRFLELRTDNVDDRSAKLPASRLNEAMFYWNDYHEEELDSPKLYWLDCYRGIAQANQALELLAAYPDKEDPQLQALYAEAFLVRAYLHFMVANIWAPPFADEETNKGLPGIPYVEKSEKNAWVSYPQENLQDTYRKIERDLSYGLAWVRDEYYQKKKFHFHKKAAYALAVRFFAYTGQWQKVIDYATYVLGNDVKKSILPYQEYKEKSVEEMVERYASEDNLSNLLITTVESLWEENYKTDRYGLGSVSYEEVFQRFSSKSIRQIEGYFKAVRRLDRTRAYWPKFTHFQSADGLLNERRGQYTRNVLLTTEEVFLHRIEAYAMTGRADLAKDDLITFINQKHIADGIGSELSGTEIENVKPADRERIQPFYRPLTQEQAAILYYVSEVARQQFIHEGLRWFDLRRFNISVDRNRVGEAKKARYVLQPEDSRKTLSLPEGVTLINP